MTKNTNSGHQPTPGRRDKERELRQLVRRDREKRGDREGEGERERAGLLETECRLVETFTGRSMLPVTTENSLGDLTAV